jgi:hypothetical protein
MDVRFRSKADISACAGHVRFTPESRHLSAFSDMSALGQKWTLDTPEVLKSRRRQLSVSHSLLNVAVTKISVQGPRIVVPCWPMHSLRRA